MLDDREQYILRDIQRHIEASDPKLARLARREQGHRTYWLSIASLVVGVVLGVALAALGPVGAGLMLIALGAVPMGVWHWRRPGTASPLQSAQIQERRG